MPDWKDAPDAPGEWIRYYLNTFQSQYLLVHDGTRLLFLGPDGKLIPWKCWEGDRWYGPIPPDPEGGVGE